MNAHGTTPGDACPCCLKAQEDIKTAVAEALADPLALLERLAKRYGFAYVERPFDFTVSAWEDGEYNINDERCTREDCLVRLAGKGDEHEQG